MEDDKSKLADEHSTIRNLVFSAKVLGLTLAQGLRNFLHPVAKAKMGQSLPEAPQLGISVSSLWPSDDSEKNWILTAGKVENLRIAARLLHGLEFAPGQMFSFWRQLGNPNFGKRFVLGREIREGCIVPVVAGGLCQLSNALYDLALSGKFEIIERHAHSKIIPGSLAEKGRDATVKWNYVDLKFKSNVAFRIEVELTSHSLIVWLKGHAKIESNTASPPALNLKVIRASSISLNDCLSCGNGACANHVKMTNLENPRVIRCLFLDESWSEFKGYVEHIIKPGDCVIAPFFSGMRLKIPRFTWTSSKSSVTKSFRLDALMRSLAVRKVAKSGGNPFATQIEWDSRIARKFSRRIPVNCQHLIVSQTLVPYLWSEGALGGRTFDVLATRLPMKDLHQRLDLGKKLHPASTTFDDFRAPQQVVLAEAAAFNAARKIITPHPAIAELYPKKAALLEWQSPAVGSTENSGRSDKILFPASGLGRKGAYEMRRLARELDFSLIILPGPSDSPDFWNDISIEVESGEPLKNVGLIIYPTYIEQQPRLLLKAQSAEIAIITTAASGLAANQTTKIVPIGDFATLHAAVTEFLLIRGGTVGKIRSE
jgi:hypothetical protein